MTGWTTIGFATDTAHVEHCGVPAVYQAGSHNWRCARCEAVSSFFSPQQAPEPEPELWRGTVTVTVTHTVEVTAAPSEEVAIAYAKGEWVKRWDHDLLPFDVETNQQLRHVPLRKGE